MIPIGDDNLAKRGFPFITALLVITNIYTFYVAVTSLQTNLFINTYALVPSSVTLDNLSSFLPFFTSMFLHGSVMHIVSNMLFLWIFGDNIEHTYGRIQFLIIYFLSGIAAAGAQYLLAPNSDIPILGASGAIAGILGVYLVRFPHNQIRTLVPFFPFFFTVHIPALVMIGLWFFTQIFNGLGTIGVDSSATQGGVAWWAHISGFIAGFILAYILPISNKPISSDTYYHQS